MIATRGEVGSPLRLPTPLPAEHLVRERVVAPVKVDGLHLAFIDTDEGVEFHVWGRGDSAWTYSRAAALAELERRLAPREQAWLDGTRYGVEHIVPAWTWDRHDGWTGGSVNTGHLDSKPATPAQRPESTKSTPDLPQTLADRLAAVMGQDRFERARAALTTTKENA